MKTRGDDWRVWYVNLTIESARYHSLSGIIVNQSFSDAAMLQLEVLEPVPRVSRPRFSVSFSLALPPSRALSFFCSAACVRSHSRDGLTSSLELLLSPRLVPVLGVAGNLRCTPSLVPSGTRTLLGSVNVGVVASGEPHVLALFVKLLTSARVRSTRRSFVLRRIKVSVLDRSYLLAESRSIYCDGICCDRLFEINLQSVQLANV